MEILKSQKIGENIDFYYFSGTGNTYLAVHKMKEVFEQAGVKVRLFRIEKVEQNNPLTIDTSNTIGLGFTVAEQGTFPFIWDFIKALPQADNTPIFMVDTMMAFSGGIIGPVKKIVKNKGYNPIGAKEIFMPNNLFPWKNYVKKNKQKITRGLKRAEKYALNLLNGKTRWGRIPFLSDMMGSLSQNEWTWKKLVGRFYGFSLDENKCSKCGICARLCPVNNIEMADFPVFADICTHCMRCIAFCPTEALWRANGRDHYRYTAVKAADLLMD